MKLLLPYTPLHAPPLSLSHSHSTSLSTTLTLNLTLTLTLTFTLTLRYEHLFDAFTIHEYTACTKSVDVDDYGVGERRSALAAWGEVEMMLQIEWLEKFYTNLTSKEIWMTEWYVCTCVRVYVYVYVYVYVCACVRVYVCTSARGLTLIPHPITPSPHHPNTPSGRTLRGLVFPSRMKRIGMQIT